MDATRECERYRGLESGALMPIHLADVFPIADPQQYKLHFARHNGREHPLDVFVRSREEWQGWQEYRPRQNSFNRPFVFSVIAFHHEPDQWLFGGIWRVRERRTDRYVVELTQQGEGFVGRLKLHSTYRMRGTRINLENQLDGFTVSEILPEPYSGQQFPGHDWLEIGFAELEALIRRDRPDWRGALEHTKGVYLITDTETGERYVGAAYGDQGVWSRWRDYVDTGHGGNVELKMLLDGRGLDYCRAHFRFALLESCSARTADDAVRAREDHWKQVLQSRGAFGLNRN